MRHPIQVERWRAMTPEQRLEEFFALMASNHAAFMSLPKEERERRERYLLEKHDREEGHTGRNAPPTYRSATSRVSEPRIDVPGDPLREAFLRALAWLDESGIRSCVIGGIAFQVHVLPRATFDVDVTVAADSDSVARLLRYAADEGAIVDEAYLRGWMDTLAGMKKVALLVPTGESIVPVDVFVVTTPFQRSAFDRRRPVAFHGTNFHVTTAEDLVLFKSIAGRRKDDADIIDLFALVAHLDVGYLKTWARELGVEERLVRLAREAGRDDVAGR